jgi:hypothetical protein
MAWVDTRVDAADDSEGLVRGEWEIGEGTASGEPSVALDQFVGATTTSLPRPIRLASGSAHNVAAARHPAPCRHDERGGRG